MIPATQYNLMYSDPVLTQERIKSSTGGSVLPVKFPTGLQAIFPPAVSKIYSYNLQPLFKIM